MYTEDEAGESYFGCLWTLHFRCRYCSSDIIYFINPVFFAYCCYVCLSIVSQNQISFGYTGHISQQLQVGSKMHFKFWRISELNNWWMRIGNLLENNWNPGTRKSRIVLLFSHQLKGDCCEQWIGEQNETVKYMNGNARMKVSLPKGLIWLGYLSQQSDKSLV